MKLIYFRYTIIAESPINPEMKKERAKPPPIVVSVDHLDDFTLPECYPKTITDLMKRITEDKLVSLPAPPPILTPSTSSGGNDNNEHAPTPVLQQTLLIGPDEREPGAARLKRFAIAKKLADEAEEVAMKKREAWLAIPKRLRGKVVSRCLRISPNLFIMFSVYRFPSRDKYFTYYGVILNVTTSESIPCSFHIRVQNVGADQNYFIKSEDWSSETQRFIAWKSVSKMVLSETDYKVGKTGFGYFNSGATEFTFKPIR